MTALLKTMRAYPAKPLKKRFGWLYDGNSTELTRTIVDIAGIDIGTCEDPIGSNRGKRIDEWLIRAGVPQSLISSGKGWWCAAWVGHVWIDAGCLVPPNYAAVDSWLPFMSPWSERRIGDAVVYGVRGDGHHIGLIARLIPTILTIEGNRSWAGTASNNGEAVDIGPLTRKDFLGVVHPVARSV